MFVLKRPTYMRTVRRVWLSFIVGQAIVVIFALLTSDATRTFWLSQAGVFVFFMLAAFISAKYIYKRDKELYDAIKNLERHKYPEA